MLNTSLEFNSKNTNIIGSYENKAFYFFGHLKTKDSSVCDITTSVKTLFWDVPGKHLQGPETVPDVVRCVFFTFQTVASEQEVPRPRLVSKAEAKLRIWEKDGRVVPEILCGK